MHKTGDFKDDCMGGHTHSNYYSTCCSVDTAWKMWVIKWIIRKQLSVTLMWAVSNMLMKLQIVFKAGKSLTRYVNISSIQSDNQKHKVSPPPPGTHIHWTRIYSNFVNFVQFSHSRWGSTDCYADPLTSCLLWVLCLSQLHIWDSKMKEIKRSW